MLLLIFPLIFWSGLINGEALAAIAKRNYRDFLIRYKWAHWTSILLLCPSSFASGEFTNYLLFDEIGRSTLLKTLLLVPFWGGLLGGFAVWSLRTVPLRWIVRVVAAVTALIITVFLLPSSGDYALLTDNNTTIKVGLFTISLLSIMISVSNMAYFLSRRDLPEDRIVTNIPDGAETTALRNIVGLLQQDGDVLSDFPTYSKFRLHSGYVTGSKIDLTALPKPEGLYLKFTHGLNPDFELQHFPKVKHVLWMKILWANVSDIQVEKLIGYRESKVVLRNSGVTIAVSGAGSAIAKYISTKPTGRADKATNVQARA
jgi:hypothetical protein